MYSTSRHPREDDASLLDERDLRWSILAEASRVFAEAGVELHVVLDTVTRHISALNGDLCVVRLISDDGEWLVPVSYAHPNPEALELLTTVLAPHYQRIGDGFHGQVIATERPLLQQSIAPQQMRSAVTADWYAYLDRFGIFSQLIVPMRARGRVIGSLGVFRSPPGPELTVEDQVLIQHLADRAAMVIDNTRLYQEVLEREQRLQDLVGRLLAAQEEERRRVAYDLHDGLAQIAAGTHQYLQAYARRHRPRSDQARSDLARALELSRRTIREARRVIANLRPTALDDFGLATAIRLHVEDLRLDGWEIEYSENVSDGRLPAAVETALFRVTQEALTNVRKHAGTQNVRIALERADGSVRLEIRDWGRGFDPENVDPGSGVSARVGLAGMRERVALVGGRHVLESAPGRGTRISVVVPLLTGTEAGYGD